MASLVVTVWLGIVAGHAKALRSHVYFCTIRKVGAIDKILSSETLRMLVHALVQSVGSPGRVIVSVRY